MAVSKEQRAELVKLGYGVYRSGLLVNPYYWTYEGERGKARSNAAFTKVQAWEDAMRHRKGEPADVLYSVA
jgi:hypothetical protein